MQRRSKKLTRSKRNALLAEMTDEVAKLVLRNNYLQTQAISMMEARATERLDETARTITNLERTGLLDRDIEFLPDEAEIDERRQRNLGFTRPEFPSFSVTPRSICTTALSSRPRASKTS